MGLPAEPPPGHQSNHLMPSGGGALAATVAAVALRAGCTWFASPAALLVEAAADVAVVAATTALYLDGRRAHRVARMLAAHAEYDDITGLVNRAGLKRALQLELRRAIRERRPLGLATLEIDGFANLADVDRVTSARRVAGLMQETGRRAGDVAAYLEDGVFMLLLPNTDAAGTTMLAEHLCGMVQVLALPLRGGHNGVMSLSIGATSALPTGATRAEDYWRAANLALADARQHGGNCVISAVPAHVQAGTQAVSHVASTP